jgi:hypothetical protein
LMATLREMDPALSAVQGVVGFTRVRICTRLYLKVSGWRAGNSRVTMGIRVMASS